MTATEVDALLARLKVMEAHMWLKDQEIERLNDQMALMRIHDAEWHENRFELACDLGSLMEKYKRFFSEPPSGDIRPATLGERALGQTFARMRMKPTGVSSTPRGLRMIQSAINSANAIRERDANRD